MFNIKSDQWKKKSLIIRQYRLYTISIGIFYKIDLALNGELFHTRVLY